MTGWQILVDTVCPAMIARYLNAISSPDEPAFSAVSIQKLEEHCDSEFCAKCWIEFLKGESE